MGASQTLLILDPKKDIFQFAAEPEGSGEALIIASRSPLRQALVAKAETYCSGMQAAIAFC